MKLEWVENISKNEKQSHTWSLNSGTACQIIYAFSLLMIVALFYELILLHSKLCFSYNTFWGNFYKKKKVTLTVVKIKELHPLGWRKAIDRLLIFYQQRSLYLKMGYKLSLKSTPRWPNSPVSLPARTILETGEKNRELSREKSSHRVKW
jgi:hypothetical protein